jgi:hypothetical protein
MGQEEADPLDDYVPTDGEDDGPNEPERKGSPGGPPGDGDGDDDGDPEGKGERRHARAPRKIKKDVEAQIDIGPDWTQWDLGRALKGLRSAVPGMRQRTIRRMHVRLWHAPAQRLRDLMSAAGLPKEILDDVQAVVDTCSVCREWQRNGNKPMASLSFTSAFNEGVQFDLLFLEGEPVVHTICLCNKWAQGMFVKSKEPEDVLPAIVHVWFRVYGPPKFLVSDQEGALFSDEGGVWADRWKVALKPKPRGAHAHTIERRNEMARQQYHKIRGQNPRRRHSDYP